MKHNESISKASEHTSREQEKEPSINNTLTTDVFVVMVENVKLNLSNNLIYNETMRGELKAYSFKKPTEESEEFCLLKRIYDGFIKKRNPEKFYCRYYAQVPLNAQKFFPGLSRNAATLLSMKLADRLLSYCKEQVYDEQTKQDALRLSDKEKAGLQYLGGYVLHNLHKKLMRSKDSELLECQQAMSVLKAGKLEKDCKSSQTLTACLDRGGLWSITTDAEKIFLRAEHYFRVFTSKACLQSINIAGVVQKCVHDEEVISSYNLLLSNSELVIEGSVGKDVLNSILNLYVKVRSFSFAKDKVQKHKISTKITKTKALRKEISRAVNKEQEVQRSP